MPAGAVPNASPRGPQAAVAAAVQPEPVKDVSVAVALLKGGSSSRESAANVGLKVSYLYGFFNMDDDRR